MSDVSPRATVALAIFVLLGSRPPIGLAADPKAGKIEWRDDYNAARKESQETGLPLLVQIGTEDCYYCRKMEATTLRDPGVAAMMGNFIPLKLDGNKEANLVKQLKVQLYPTTVLAGADGTIHAFVQGHVGADAFKEQLKNTTDLVAADLKLGKDVNEAAAAMKAGEFGKAIPNLRRLTLVTKGKTQEAKVKALLAEAESIGADRLAKAAKLATEGRIDDAARALNELTRSFDGTETATKAEAQLVAMGVDRTDRIAIALRATQLLTAARDLAKAGAYAEALDVAELLATTAEAKAATKLAAEIKADTNKLATAARQANEKAAALQLALADTHLAKGRTDEAAKCLELAIRLAPNSPKAEQAEGRLAKLRGGLPAIPVVRQK